MARECKTAAALLSVIAGKDVINDPATAAIPFSTIPDYAKACTENGLKGARIGKLTFQDRAVCSAAGRAIGC